MPSFHGLSLRNKTRIAKSSEDSVEKVGVGGFEGSKEVGLGVLGDQVTHKGLVQASSKRESLEGARGALDGCGWWQS